MKHSLRLPAIAAMGFAIGLALPLPSHANPIADHPVFRLLVGKWKGSGELIDANGSKTAVTETWTGEFTDTGNFLMSGTRTLGQNEHQFAWEYYPNDDLIEGQMKISEPELDRRFEVEASTTDRFIKMKIPMDSAGTIMEIVNQPAKDGKSIEGSVKIVNQAGEVTLEGTVTHKKEAD